MQFNTHSMLERGLLLLLVYLLIPNVSAHEIRPVITNIELLPNHHIQLDIKMNLEAWLAGVSSEHTDTRDSPQSLRYEGLREWQPQRLAQLFRNTQPTLSSQLTLQADSSPVDLTLKQVDVPVSGSSNMARYSRVTFSGTLPVGTTQLNWQHDQALGDVVVRVQRDGQSEPLYAGLVNAGQTSQSILLQPTTLAHQDFMAYVEVGLQHIIPKGLDHILFIIGLFLLVPKLKPLLWQVTSFTVAHSITLSLGIFGLVQIPPSIVEPIIALSILIVAFENLITDRFHGWRPVYIFVFGLIHGLGFASVLQSFGLPKDQFLAALLGFNVGVELGQLCVILACFLTVGWFRNKTWYRATIVLPCSALVGLLAAYWVAERIEIL